LSLSVRSCVVGLVATFSAAGMLFVPAFARADAPTVTALSSKLGVRTLRVGDHGTRVKALQQLLTATGFKTTVDGQYGSGTAKVVRRFQRASNLTATGIADRATLSALQHATDGSAAKNASGGFGVRSAGASSQHLGDRIPLRQGMSGHDVKILQDFLTRAGFRTTTDGEFGSGTVRSVKQFETAQQVTVNGVVDASDIERLRALASGQGATMQPVSAKIAPLAAGDQATVGADGLAIAPQNAPVAVQQIIAAGNAIATKPYHYGGGHGRWEDSGYDCSGSVSYALHGAGLLDQALTSSDFESWGEPGPGQWVTIYADSGHVYMVVAGLRFDTSGRQEDGTRWHTSQRSGSGYTVVHPPGL
jgi:peptidoglycan hydrolase-like protein with peptidoglycan-binding domain